MYIERKSADHSLLLQMEETLVYFGAGWDAKALGKKDYKRFKSHLYIDALPNLSHYSDWCDGYDRAKDLASFIAAITASIGKYKLKAPPVCNGNQWLFELRDGRTVEYWVNTTVEEALKNPYLREKISLAKWIHTAGFEPREYGFKQTRDAPLAFANLHELREDTAQRLHRAIAAA